MQSGGPVVADRSLSTNVKAGLWLQRSGGSSSQRSHGGVDARDGSGLQLSVVSESECAVDDGKGCHGVLPDTVSELTSLPGEDGIEHGPRHCTSLAATVQERGQQAQAQAWVVVARWDGTQIRSEKGRLHNERGKKSGPGRGRGKVARPGWGFLNDGLGWVWRPSSGFLGSFSFSLSDRQTNRPTARQAWASMDWSCAGAGTEGGLVPTITAHRRFSQLFLTCVPQQTQQTQQPKSPGWTQCLSSLAIIAPSVLDRGEGAGGGFWGGASAVHTVRGSQSIRWES